MWPRVGGVWARRCAVGRSSVIDQGTPLLSRPRVGKNDIRMLWLTPVTTTTAPRTGATTATAPTAAASGVGRRLISRC
ncbi:hypothetical protein HanIR_Chr04g0166741 [Helianthus annuus]|nr:hypothetical protein HanIR_Chr04g0166741 [Helianthus annuus]